jgi:hypothetical protein
MDSLRKKISSKSTSDFVRRVFGRGRVEDGEELGGEGEDGDGKSDEHLCTRCRKIDFDRLLDPKRIARLNNTFSTSHVLDEYEDDDEHTRKELLSLGRRFDWVPSSCRLCHFWHACLETGNGNGNGDRSYSSSPWSFVALAARAEVTLNQNWGTVFGLLPGQVDGRYNEYATACYMVKAISQRKKPAVQARLIGHVVDASIPRQWLDDCLKHHNCTPKKISPGYSAVPLDGMRLVHCRGRKVVVAKASHDYAALSYVWGVASTNEPASCELGALPLNLPQTVEDALKFTAMLDIDYLWVDRLCIVNDSEVKHEQIANMDKIYQGAMLTIIAASGDSASHGLPGVSRSRTNQPQIRVGSHHLISTLADPRQGIESSVWATRGWTYQEALLSQRRLFFSDQQTYYECGNLCRLESLHHKSHAAEDEINPIFELGRPLYDINWSYINLNAIIQSYTERNLTYESDALNGLLGVLRAHSRSNAPQYHFCGMPMVNRRQENDSSPTDLVMALGWDVRREPASRPSKRRTSFPSWCWTGWETAVLFPAQDRDAVYDGDVGFETVDGDILSWESGLAIIKSGEPDLLSTFIHLDTWAYQTTFRHNGSNFYDRSSRAVLRLTSDITLISDDLRQRLQTDVWTCIKLKRYRSMALVVDWVGDVAYRIGLLRAESIVESRFTKRKIKLG